VPAEIVFCPIVGEFNHEDRYQEFRRLRDRGLAQIFVHPLHGSYRARLGDCSVRRRADAVQITVSAEFIPDEVVQTTGEAGENLAPIAGPEAVAVAAELVGRELEVIVSATSDAPGNAVAAATSWSEQEVPNSRSVYLELATTTGELDAMVDDLDLVQLETWQAYVEVIALRSALRECAQATAQETTQASLVEVKTATPLLAICAREVGAHEAAAYADLVAQVNDLRDTLLVPAGTVLRLPVRA
jgi:hypothetical protein